MLKVTTYFCVAMTKQSFLTQLQINETIPSASTGLNHITCKDTSSFVDFSPVDNQIITNVTECDLDTYNAVVAKALEAQIEKMHQPNQ